MRNPLKKRYLRELKSEFGKYMVVFLLMIGTICLASGFLVADNSVYTAYTESFEKYHIESGNFELAQKAAKKQKEEIEKNDVKLYENFYKERQSKDQTKLRIYINREEVNQTCLMEGTMPDAKDEVVVDRMFAKNNDMKIGDRIQLGSQIMTITGYAAFPDYSCLFENNTDMMFDAQNFGVASVTREGFETLGDENTHYSYSWIYNERPENDTEEKKMAENLIQNISKNAVVTNFIPEYANQAIQFTGSDMGSDKQMIIVLTYILIAIIAFVFAVTISNTIAAEAGVIGTLRASGYTKGELVRHYMTLPLLVTLISALIGNVLGYTVMKDVFIDIYYQSYSLTTYQTLWNEEAFVLTTVVPFFIMLAITCLMLIKKLSLSPLQFIRRDLKKNKRKRTIKLPNFRFFTRFRIRIILQNKSNYITLLIGIIFANLLLFFGLWLPDMLSNYQEQVEQHMISTYQYVLKAPQETENADAEKYAIDSLETLSGRFMKEDISVFGITKNSKYMDISVASDEVYVSEGYAEKYDVEIGERISLKKKYSDEKVTFKVVGTYKYPATLAVFMDLDEFNQVFDHEDGYYNGYLANQTLSDLDETYIATVITKKDMTKLSRQLDISMGEMMKIVQWMSMFLFMALIYLLSKIVIEKNASSISMTKILGYTDAEIGNLYITSTTIVVILCMLLSFPIVKSILVWVMHYWMFSRMTGWLGLAISTDIYVKMFLMGLVGYAVVVIYQYRKIKKIPMAEALKNRE